VCVEIMGQKHWINIGDAWAFEEDFASIFPFQSDAILFKLALKISLLSKIEKINSNFRQLLDKAVE